MALCFSPSPPAAASLLGPSDFDECILENLKGVTSDEAARLIARSCAKKFPKTVPPNFDDRYGDRGVISGHVYERGGLSNPIRMEGARVRLLKPASVVPALRDHSQAGEKFYERAIDDRLEEEIPENLQYLSEERQKRKKDVEFSEHRLGLLREELKDLQAENLEMRQQSETTTKAAETQLSETTKKHDQAAAGDTKQQAELNEKLSAIESGLVAKRQEFAAAQADADKAYETRKEKLRKSHARKKVAAKALQDELRKSRAALVKEADAKIAAARQKSQKLAADIERATRDQAAAIEAEAARLRDAYVKGSIRVKNYAVRNYRTDHCFTVTNTGKLAIRSLTLGMKFNGKPVGRLGIRVKDISSIDPGLWLYNLIRSGSSYGNLIDARVTPMIKNRYKEEVHGIGPGQTWPRASENDGCLHFNRYSITGDIQRAFEKIGGFRDTGWAFYLKSVDLAHPETLRSQKKSYSSEKLWTYPQQPTTRIFKRQLDAALPNMEPYKRRKRLEGQRPAAAKAIKSREAEKAAMLKDFDHQNAPMLAQLKSQEAGAKKDLDSLARTVVGGDAIDALEQEKRQVSEAISALIAAASKRKTEIGGHSKKLSQLKATWETQLAASENELERKSKEIEEEQEKLGTLGGKLKELDAGISSLKQRSGDTYQQLIEWTRKKVMSNRDKDSAWFDQLLQLMDTAEGSDVRVDLDGAYEFDKVPYGDYLIYVNHTYRRTKLLWLAAVKVTGKTKLELGPFNSIANPHRNMDAVTKAVNRAISGR